MFNEGGFWLVTSAPCHQYRAALHDCWGIAVAQAWLTQLCPIIRGRLIFQAFASETSHHINTVVQCDSSTNDAGLVHWPCVVSNTCVQRRSLSCASQPPKTKYATTTVAYTACGISGRDIHCFLLAFRHSTDASAVL